MRDFQRSRVYRAEPPTVPDPDLLTLADCAAFVRRVQTSRWWKTHVRAAFSSVPIEVVAGRAHGMASAWIMVTQDTGWNATPFIKLPLWAYNRHTILHEMAHIAAGNEHHHGPRFASMYLKLVRRFLGVEWARVLRDSFVRNGVKHHAR